MNRAIEQRRIYGMRWPATCQPSGIEVMLRDDDAIDRVAECESDVRSFLRASWFRSTGIDLVIPAAQRRDRVVIAAIPTAAKRIGPLRIREVTGPYWPFRSIPLSQDITDGELIAFLADPVTRKSLGRAWRLGPVFAGDSAVERIVSVSEAAGWTVLERRLGTAYEIDIAELRAAGDWPRPKTMRKNRWRERRMEEWGGIDYLFFTGDTWSSSHLDAMAEIERKSWLAGMDRAADFKFADPQNRIVWESLVGDRAIAPMLFGSLMTIGGDPAAFTFGIETGATRYYVANNYSEKYGKFGPGKILLYRDFARAADMGVKRINCGSGDAGYKTEMGAEPGPAIRDLLFVRSKTMAALLRPLFEKTG